MRERCSCKRTNLSNKSLILEDRTNKGTLPLTILRCIFKSSAKNFTFPIFGARRPANLSAYWPDLTKYDSEHKFYLYTGLLLPISMHKFNQGTSPICGCSSI
jgi:hypothetical protein